MTNWISFRCLQRVLNVIHDTSGRTLPIESRKRRKFPHWDGERRSFNTFIREVVDCIEIDRDLMASDRAVCHDINFSLPTVAKNKVAVFNSSGTQVQWDFRKFIEHLRRTFGNRQEKEDTQELLSKLR
ncbi:putative eka-like protein [Erysiphe neolycopersici]|uniref:Putative eka-like protein n=1 Tax=Erysiphe neolycopersici TaxID=212602 RepID=A0A420H7I1_9PEZI|nr:putative eka-like protein [Erysiphe neolycopersici]